MRSLSPWSISMGSRCGEQYRRRIVLGQIIPPGAAAGRGRGFHSAVEVNFKQKITTHLDMPEDTLTDAARDGFVYAFRNGIHLHRDDVAHKATILNDFLNQTINLTKKFRVEIAPNVQPTEAEIRLEADIGEPNGRPLAGVIDFVQEGGLLDDFKTAGRSWNQAKVDQELQHPIYSYLWAANRGALPRQFGYHVLVSTPSGQLKKQRLHTRITNQRIEGMLARARTINQMEQRGIFPPADPGSWVCSEKWCGYYLPCPYVGNGAKRWI